TYRLDLSDELKDKGIHNAFHASLLRPHVPSDDRRFPGRQMKQIDGFNEAASEWAVDRILSHDGNGEDAMFELQWSSGDVTWATYHEVKHLEALTAYCEAMGVAGVRQL
ncbi:hypothetical protein FA95DRAFT_1450216, partial [Auriscalpium vulgare]